MSTTTAPKPRVTPGGSSRAEGTTGVSKVEGLSGRSDEDFTNVLFDTIAAVWLIKWAVFYALWTILLVVLLLRFDRV